MPLISPPAENVPPAPVSTTARMVGFGLDPLHRVHQRLAHRHRQGVAPRRVVEGEDDGGAVPGFGQHVRAPETAAARRCGPAARPRSGPSTMSTTREPLGRHVEHGEVGVDAADGAGRGQRIAAAAHQARAGRPWSCAPSRAQSRLAPTARSIAPPTAGAVSFSRRGPVGDVAVLRHLERAEHAQIEMPAADHGEAVGVVDSSCRRASSVTCCLPALISQGSRCSGARRRAHAEHAVLAVEHHLALGRHVVGDQGRDADAEVDVPALGDVARERGRPSRCGCGRAWFRTSVSGSGR